MISGSCRFVATIAVAVAVAAAPAGAAEKPKAPKILAETRIAEQVKPGTVLIVHDEAAPISLPTADFNIDLLVAAIKSNAELNALAAGGDLPGAVQKAVERFVLPDPTRFFRVISRRNVAAEATFTGSGAVVSGDGYIVTNAHVVAPDTDTVVDALIDDVSDSLKTDVAAIQRKIDTTFGSTLSVATKQALTSGYIKFVARNSTLGERKATTSVLSGVASPAERKARGKVAEIVELGKDYPDKDVAVLKVAASNLFTIPIGPDADVTSGTKVFAIGYPGTATFASGAAKDIPLEPSISSGSVAARRTVEGGYSVIQHSAAIQSGSSGGPMVDETGRIVGLTTAGNTGADAGTFFFSVPSSLVSEFLQRKNLQVEPSPTTVAYIAALDEFDQKHYKKALAQLDELNRTNPDLAFVTDKRAAAQRRIDAGEDVAEPSLPIIPLAIGAGLLVLMLIGVLAGIGLRGRARQRRSGQGPPASGTPALYAAPAGYAPPPQVGSPPGWPGAAPPPPGARQRWPPPTVPTQPPDGTVRPFAPPTSGGSVPPFAPPPSRGSVPPFTPPPSTGGAAPPGGGAARPPEAPPIPAPPGQFTPPPS